MQLIKVNPAELGIEEEKRLAAEAIARQKEVERLGMERWVKIAPFYAVSDYANCSQDELGEITEDEFSKMLSDLRQKQAEYNEQQDKKDTKAINHKV